MLCVQVLSLYVLRLDTMLRQEMLSIFILWDHNTTWDEIVEH